ncbi:DUF397 domain-containing protein [Streptomyces niger]|uniref:DUF397 domain-containing protein n=1 Tax=Streptomyces niger TaxID=66373 RepID=UPI0006997C13|nr:DUF397 domain-containing protein [Streptomyces niger]
MSVNECVEQAWFKSSYSTGSGGECVEVAQSADKVHVRDSKDKAGPMLSIAPAGWTAFVEFAEQAWFKSSYSSGEGGECVEMAQSADKVHVRDSKDKAGPVLSIGPAGWAAFVAFAARG